MCDLPREEIQGVPGEKGHEVRPRFKEGFGSPLVSKYHFTKIANVPDNLINNLIFLKQTLE